MMASIDKAGRIVVPKQARDQLGLVDGTPLEVSVEGDSIRIRPVGRAVRTYTVVDGLPVFAPSDDGPLTDLDVQRLRDADRR